MRTSHGRRMDAGWTAREALCTPTDSITRVRGPPSFTYKELVTATDDFNDSMLVGKGGFGRVYKGVFSKSTQSVAIKRVSLESKQGKREFMAEIAILGRIRHRNIFQLLGYCRHKEEQLFTRISIPSLIGTLSQFWLLASCTSLRTGTLSSSIEILRQATCFLTMNASLSDFGLARLHDHGADAHTTHVAGTWGFTAPELPRLGKATKASDMVAFGVFITESVCGDGQLAWSLTETSPLCLQTGCLACGKVALSPELYPNLVDYDPEDAELVLKLGLLCSQSLPKLRPCMHQVMLYLVKGARLPEFCPASLSIDRSKEDKEIDTNQVLCSSAATSITTLSGGR